MGLHSLLEQDSEDVQGVRRASGGMKEISFNWTVTAFLSGHKTVTRRDWKDSYAKTFKKGEIVAAYSKQRRFGGKKIGLIKLTQDPYKQSTANLTDDDWFEEGMHVLEGEGRMFPSRTGDPKDAETPTQFWEHWKRYPEDVWVIRFRIVGR